MQSLGSSPEAFRATQEPPPALKLFLPLAAKLPLIQQCTGKIVLQVPAEVQARCIYGTSQISQPRSPVGEEKNYQANTTFSQ